jgi:hypothetical protein
MGGKNVLFNSKEINDTAQDLRDGGCGCGCKGGKSYSKKKLFKNGGNKVVRDVLQKL